MFPTSTAIFRRPSAEEAELLRLRAELAALRAALALREAELAHQRGRLASFKGRYIRQVGVLYIKLDEWETRIAELNGAPLPPIESLETPALPAPGPEPIQLDLKALFREVAKRIHPDRARNQHDEQHRTYLMAQANDAYNRSDAAILFRMLNGHNPASDATGTSPDLEHTRAQIQQTIADIAAIDAETETIAQSEMAQLLERSILAATKGQDLLAALAARVKGRISLAMRRYEFDVARIKRKEAPFDPTALLSAETAGPADRR